MSNNYTITPQGLTFPAAPVVGSIAGIANVTPTTLSFYFTNNSGSSITITNYGFSTSTEGDAVTQPVGIYSNSDFTVAVTGGRFPVTVTNGSKQQFSVTYQPLRRASGFGDVRSAILTLFSGQTPITNGGQTLNSSGEVINLGLPVPVTVGVGGGVTEEGYDWPTVHPIYWSSGTVQSGNSGVANNVQGVPPNLNLSDLDTMPHYSPMMFWTAFQTSTQTSTPRALAGPVSSNTPPYGTLTTAAINGSPRGGRGYQLLVFFNTTTTSGVVDDTLSFDLTIKAHTSASDVVVATYTGLNYSNVSSLFIGNQEGLDLQGLSLIAVTANLKTNGTTYNTTSAYNIGAVITS